MGGREDGHPPSWPVRERERVKACAWRRYVPHMLPSCVCVCMCACVRSWVTGADEKKNTGTDKRIHVK